MEQRDYEVLVRWLEGEFRAACLKDVMRLRESMMILKFGHEAGRSSEELMGVAIASFVRGLIRGEQPITVPVENN